MFWYAVAVVFFGGFAVMGYAVRLESRGQRQLAHRLAVVGLSLMIVAIIVAGILLARLS